jgi:hypothetical protein
VMGLSWLALLVTFSARPAWRTSARVNGVAVGVEIPITVSSLRLRRQSPCIAAIAALMSPPSRSALQIARGCLQVLEVVREALTR